MMISLKTFKNFSALLTGSSLAQIIPLLAAPVLTRLYTPGEYGELGVFMSVSAILSILATMQYSQAILYSETNEEAKLLTVLCWFLSITIAFFLTVVVWSLGNYLEQWGDFKSIKQWLPLLPGLVLMGGINASLIMWANRHQAYNAISLSRFSISIVTVSVSLVMGFLGKGVFGLISGLLMGYLAGICSIYFMMKGCRPKFKIKGQYRNIVLVARRYKKFAIFSLPSEFVNQLSNQLPIFFLATISGAATVGIFNRSRQILGLPVFLLAGSITPIFQEKASKEFVKNGDCSRIYLKTFVILLFSSILPFFILIVYGPDIFAFIFGEAWRMSGNYAQILGCMFLFKFIVSPLSSIFQITERQSENFYYHIYIVVSSAGSLYLGHYLYGTTEMMLLFFSINFSIVYAFYFVRGYFLSLGRGASHDI